MDGNLGPFVELSSPRDEVLAIIPGEFVIVAHVKADLLNVLEVPRN